MFKFLLLPFYEYEKINKINLLKILELQFSENLYIKSSLLFMKKNFPNRWIRKVGFLGLFLSLFSAH